jgi:DNA-binding CsgD family transcriptional regulator/tetratricopeptide (TPR) repeat protein
VLVCGPEGVGKTRLAEEFAAQAGRHGPAPARATASAAAAAVPLGAVAHLLPPAVDMSDPVRGFAQAAEAFTAPRRGQERPAALLLDDLHLLDAASAMLLRQLLDAGALRLIATMRTDRPANDAIRALVSGDGAHRIDLGPFTADQTATVLWAALDGPVARGTTHELHTGSGGNALYLRELVLGALHDGTLGFDGELWRLSAHSAPAGTPRLAELVQARLAGLDPNELAVLELLAVCAPVSLADAVAVAGDPAVPSALERNGLIRITVERRRTGVLPAHPLYADVLRARMPVLRRRELLSAQAERLEATGARRRDDALRIAACRLGATGTADPALLAEAAGLARHAYDYPLARTLLEAVPRTALANAGRIMLAEVLYQLGDADRAREEFAEADAQAHGDAELMAVTLARSFSLFWMAGRPGEALEVNRRALERITDPEARRMLRYNEGSMLIANGDLPGGLALLEDMEEHVHEAPDSMAWLMGATMRALALGLTGRAETEIRMGEEQYAANSAVREQTLFPHPATQLIQLSLALCRNGEIDRAREVAEHGHATLISTAATPLTTLWITLGLGDIESRAGHAAAARRWFAEAVALARAHGFVTPLHPALSGLAVNAALLGDRDAAEQAAAEAAAYPVLGLYRVFEFLVPAWLAASGGRLAEARGVLATGAGLAARAGMATSEAMLLTDIARLGGAAEVADRLAVLAEVCDGRLAPARARFARALADDDAEQLDRVAEEFAQIGTDLMAAEAAAAAAAAHSRCGDPRRATASTRRADALLRRCGPARTPLLAAGQRTAALTARERGIAALAAKGTPSRQIAEGLSLSVRTVENHLQRVYTKLGVSNRRELLAALDSAPPDPDAVLEV